jgi:hypothetical protein
MTDRSNAEVIDRAGPPPTPRWKGRQSLEIVYRFNERCFQMIGESVGANGMCGAPAIAENRDLWSRLDEVARERAARFPFLILDVHFRNQTWWRNVIDGTTVGEIASAHSYSLAEALMEETLLFAAQTVHWDASVARLTLGMSPEVVELLQGLHPQLMASIWRKHSGELRLRWQEQPLFWRPLLVAACDADDEALSERHLDAQLRFCTELLDSCD